MTQKGIQMAIVVPCQTPVQKRAYNDSICYKHKPIQRWWQYRINTRNTTHLEGIVGNGTWLISGYPWEWIPIQWPGIRPMARKHMAFWRWAPTGVFNKIAWRSQTSTKGQVTHIFSNSILQSWIPAREEKKTDITYLPSKQWMQQQIYLELNWNCKAFFLGFSKKHWNVLLK